MHYGKYTSKVTVHHVSGLSEITPVLPVSQTAQLVCTGTPWPSIQDFPLCFFQTSYFSHDQSGQSPGMTSRGHYWCLWSPILCDKHQHMNLISSSLVWYIRASQTCFPQLCHCALSSTQLLILYIRSPSWGGFLHWRCILEFLRPSLALGYKNFHLYFTLPYFKVLSSPQKWKTYFTKSSRKYVCAVRAISLMQYN